MVRKIGREALQQREAALRAILGDAGYAALQQYSTTIPQRNVAEQLVAVLGQNAFNPREGPAPGNRLNGTVISQLQYRARFTQAGQQNGMSVVDWQAPITDAAIERAHSMLTPTQLAALKGLQATQALQFQLAPPPPGGALPMTMVMLSGPK
jgi:hypothetical protein